MYSLPRRSRSYADDPIKLLNNLRQFKDLRRDIDSQQKQVCTTIGAGEYYLCNSDESINTIIGGGVCCAIRDRSLKIGGLNHFMRPDDTVLCWADKLGCYSCNAMEILINGLFNLGAKRQNLEAKVFGGAYIDSSGNPDKHKGRLNIQYAVKYLDRENIPVQIEDVGGTCVRKLLYKPFTGEASVKRVDVRAKLKAQTDDQAYLQRLHAQDYFGEVELWRL